MKKTKDQTTLIQEEEKERKVEDNTPPTAEQERKIMECTSKGTVLITKKGADKLLEHEKKNKEKYGEQWRNNFH